MADREKVVSEFERWCDEMEDECPVICLHALYLLKEQEAKHGEWIAEENYDDIYYRCSACDEPWVLIEGTPFDNGMKYCPNCGAKMEGR